MNFKEEFVKDSKAILDLGIEEEGKRQEKVEVFVKEITHKNYKELCKENDLGLCLIAFVDGKDKTTMKKSINFLKDLQKREDIKGESNDESKSSFRMAVKGRRSTNAVVTRNPPIKILENLSVVARHAYGTVLFTAALYKGANVENG